MPAPGDYDDDGEIGGMIGRGLVDSGNSMAHCVESSQVTRITVQLTVHFKGLVSIHKTAPIVPGGWLFRMMT
jgi:hypothetical protein